MKFLSHYLRGRNLKKVIKSDRLRSDLPFKQWRSLWITTSTLVTVIATVGIVTAAFQFGLPWWMQEGDHNHLYESDVGSLRYQVYLPTSGYGCLLLLSHPERSPPFPQWSASDQR
jgi:hypothetical protein